MSVDVWVWLLAEWHHLPRVSGAAGICTEGLRFKFLESWCFQSYSMDVGPGPSPDLWLCVLTAWVLYLVAHSWAIHGLTLCQMTGNLKAEAISAVPLGPKQSLWLRHTQPASGYYWKFRHNRRWFESYVTARKQAVRMGSWLSDPKTVISGVSQGSILGPVFFFCLYTNDITTRIKEHFPGKEVGAYADDTRPLNQCTREALPTIKNFLPKNYCYKDHRS